MGDISLAEVRKYVFDCFVETSRAPLVEEVMRRFGVGRDVAVGLLEELQAAHHLLLLPGTQRILMANPFSNLPTPYRVAAGAREYFANCAWDALALHVVLDRDVHVSSFCHHCGASVELGLSRGKRRADEGADLVIFLGTPVSKWYDNLVVTCSNTMVFFASRDHLKEWKETHPGLTGEALTVDKMLEVVAPISKGRATLEYRMPSRADLMTYWDSIGMRGPFWTF